MTALRNRSLETMYRPGYVARLIADCSGGFGMITVGIGMIVYALVVR